MVGSVILLVLAIGLYFLPTIVAASAHHRNAGAIFLLNLLLGWTLLGWIAALVWSATDPGPQPEVAPRHVESVRETVARTETASHSTAVLLGLLLAFAALVAFGLWVHDPAPIPGRPPTPVEHIGAVDSTSEPPAPPLPPTWEVRDSPSEMGDKPTVSLWTEADRSIGEGALAATPALIVRCERGKTDVLRSAGMVLGEAAVRLRLDDSPARKQRWTESTNRKALFAPSPVPLARELLKHDRLLFEFTPFQAGDTTVGFDLRGLRAEIHRVQKACGWK